jgi:hypothetical protein
MVGMGRIRHARLIKITHEHGPRHPARSARSRTPKFHESLFAHGAVPRNRLARHLERGITANMAALAGALVAPGDRLDITVLSERLGDVLYLPATREPLEQRTTGRRPAHHENGLEAPVGSHAEDWARATTSQSADLGGWVCRATCELIAW